MNAILYVMGSGGEGGGEGGLVDFVTVTQTLACVLP